MKADVKAKDLANLKVTDQTLLGNLKKVRTVTAD